MRKNSSYWAVASAPRAAAVALTAAGLLAAGLAAPAAARPPIGPVKALTAVVTKPGANYRVSADWADLTGAVSYKVTLTNMTTGKVLATDTVTSSEWIEPTTAPVNNQVKVTVQPRSSTRNGRSASITKVLPDLTAPVGSYDVNWAGLDATVSELALSDDLSLPAGITREINWGEEGGAFEPWTTGSSVNHGYPAVGRYVPQVRLTDQHENTVTLTLHAVVIGDTTAPVGVFGTTAPAKVWARFTPVTVTESALSDDFSPANKVVRVVNWGDGSVPTPWTDGVTVSHVYQGGGTFTPKVSLADEAGNTITDDATAVTVLVDNLAPKVTLTVPKYGVRAVRSWRTIKGKAKDAGVGMGKVRVRAVEKRGTVWYSYLPAKKIWVRGGTTRVAALKFAGVAKISPSATNAWQLRLVNLRKGTLVIQYSAIDKLLNRTKFFTRVQALVKS